jgi:hypothetical protein
VQSTLSLAVAPEVVRDATPLAPLLLQTEELITDLLAERLHTAITARTLDERMERIGLVRKSLMSGGEVPLYLAVTVITRGPWLRPLRRELAGVPPPLFGIILKQAGLFGRKNAPEVRRSALTAETQRRLQVTETDAAAWERTYAILTPQNAKVAGVTEIFSPRLEELLRTAS